jgi:hypothetical protein
VENYSGEDYSSPSVTSSKKNPKDMLFQLITFTWQKLEVQTTKTNPKAETNRILAAGTVKQVYNVISLIQRLFAIAINLATRHVVPEYPTIIS